MNQLVGSAWRTVPLLLLVAGCRESAPPPLETDPHAGHDHAHGKEVAAVAWCVAHDVPEAECTRCNPTLIAKFKAANDWCAGHGVPESHCIPCNPELEAKFAAMRPAGPAEAGPPEPGGLAVERVGFPLRGPNDPRCDVESLQVRLADPSVAKAAGIRTERVARRPVRATIECPAEVNYNETKLARVTPRVGGVVVEVAADPGTAVKAGATLAVIESPTLGDAKSQYIEKRETYLLARTDWARHDAIHNAVERLMAACENASSPEALREASAAFRLGEFKSRLLRVHANLDLARANHVRQQQLAEKGVTSQEALQTAQRDRAEAEAEFAAAHEAIDLELEREHLQYERAVKVARVAMEAAERKLRVLGLGDGAIAALDEGRASALSRYTLTSPLDGVVVEREAVIGESVDERDRLFVVADLSTMWLMLNLDERDAVGLRTGLPVLFSIDGLPSRSVQGAIEWIRPEVDHRTRTVQARLTLPNESNALRAYMYGTARIGVHENEPVLTVPDAAVQSDGCCQLVFVQESPTVYRPHKVSLGVKAGGYYAVLDGVTEGEAVATAGSFLLKTEILKTSIGAGCCEVEPGR
jgi:cobalt-zinc-cadmium efflux system membrane fusion protein